MERSAWRSRGMRLAVMVALVASLGLCLSACGGDGDESPLLVSAASSLSTVFEDLADSFEAAHPDVAVTLSFAGSQALSEQVLDGAPFDVLATADDATMAEVVLGFPSAIPEAFATNVMTIAVPAGNPGGVSGLSDFADPELFIGLCAPAVPCGVYAGSVLAAAGVEPSVDTEESSVRSLALKIGLSEIDAGIVYATDVAASDGTLDAIRIPDELNVSGEYLIAALASDNAKAAAFVDFVLSDAGRAIITSYGFGTP